MASLPTVKVFAFENEDKVVDANLTKEELLHIIDYMAKEIEDMRARNGKHISFLNGCLRRRHG